MGGEPLISRHGAALGLLGSQRTSVPMPENERSRKKPDLTRQARAHRSASPREPRAPSYKGRAPSSEAASAAARGASKKADTASEMRLRRVLWRAGCRYRTNLGELPGRPDVVFTRARLAVFCDGDFWHGKAWEERRTKLAQGTNADYWLAKIERNMERDARSNERLERDGWTVLRFWESQIQNDVEAVVAEVLEILDARGHRKALDRRT